MRFLSRLAGLLFLGLLLALLLIRSQRSPALPAAPLADPALLPAPPAVGVAPAAPLVSPARSPEPSHPARLRASTDALWRQPIPEPEFSGFREWSDRFLAASGDDRSALEAEGVALAQVRREEMSALIRSNPERALALAVPFSVRLQLPEAVVERMEQRVDGRGELAVLGAVPLPGREGDVAPSWRTATVQEQIYTAHVYGRRLDEPTRGDVPLHGLALDGHLAVDENPVRLLEPAEAEAQGALSGDPVCSVSGQSAAEWGTAVAVDDGENLPRVLCSSAHAEEYNDRLLDVEANSGSTEVSLSGGIQLTSAFTEGIKRLILIRVDFPDKAGAPFANDRGTNLVRAIDQFYRENSYGRAGFRAPGDGSIVTPTLRLAKTTVEYGSLDASQLRKDARAAARAAGFVLENYDFDVTCFRSVPGYGWAGLGYVGAPGAWVQDAFGESGGVFSHELGHNFGLNHANFWDTGGESVTGTRGTDVEYGDSFDTMGNASGGRRQFNVRNKAALNWLRGSSEIQTLSSSGTYRLVAHDQTNSTGIRALRFRKNSKTNYWFEYRARFADNRWMSNGIGVRRARSDSSRQSQLLDVTAGSADGKNDSALVIGRTFSDPEAGLHITPIARDDSGAPTMEVVFNQGPFPDNHRPSLSVTAQAASVPLNTPVALTATAADDDGDALAYGWDFGDGGFGPNTGRVTNRWSVAGDYVVRCVVSDMKGGTASDYVVVRVGNPSTFRISGQVHRDGHPLDGVRVFTSNTRMTYTGSDGTYVLTGVPRGTHTLKAQAEGLLFTRDGFANPLNITASRANLNFIGALPGDLDIASLVPAGAEWLYQDEGLNLGTAWRSAAFDDSQWKRGPAQLGYGDEDVVTTIGFGPDEANKYITSYFRHAFQVEERGRILNATLGVSRDDGAVVYLNGREIFRSNMPDGTTGYLTLASASVGGADESTYFETDLAAADFLEGRNVLAVEVHQHSGDSSDVSFNLRLDALLAPTSGVGLFPTLTTQTTPEGVQVSWPSAFTGYSLQSRSSLDGTQDWAPLEFPVVSQGDKNIALLPAADAVRFLRLSR